MEYYGYTKEELTELLYLIDTKELDIKLTKCITKDIEQKDEIVQYKTLDDKDIVYNNYGCYAIYNETLKIIYIGETITSFHKRWKKHYYNINNDTRRKQELLRHPDTICTVIYVSNGDKEETENIEAQTIEWYKEEYHDWTILGGTYRDNRYGRR